MKMFFFVPLICSFLLLPQQSLNDASQIEVTTYKWSKARRTIENTGAPEGITPPASAMIPQNKNFSRNVRVNDPQGTRDPNADTLDGRSAQIEKNVQEARSPQTKQVDGFAYRVKIRNSGAQVVEIVFWEYQFTDPANESNTTRHQFLCGLSLGSGKEKELEGFSASNPSNVVNVESLAKKETSFRQKVVINRVEYADGTIWQRKDWSLKEVKASYERALKEQWQPGMCKGL
jgi:hypothetical protein